MKKILIPLFFIFITPLLSNDDIQGLWKGEAIWFNRGAPHPFELQFLEGSEIKMYFLDKDSILNIAEGEYQMIGDSVIMTFDATRITYHGRIEDGAFAGNMIYNGDSKGLWYAARTDSSGFDGNKETVERSAFSNNMKIKYYGLDFNCNDFATRIHLIFRPDMFNYEYMVFSSAYQMKDRNSYYSMNFLLTMPYYFATMFDINEDKSKSTIEYILWAPYLFHCITNPGYRLPLIGDAVSVRANINTDYYFFYENSKIYSQFSCGMRLEFLGMATEFNYNIPLTKNNYQINENYYGVGIYWVL